MFTSNCVQGYKPFYNIEIKMKYINFFFVYQNQFTQNKNTRDLKALFRKKIMNLLNVIVVANT